MQATQQEIEAGDELIETAQSIHFIPNNGFVEWALPDLVQMPVGTTINGHLRVRDEDGERYIEGTIEVLAEGLMFNEADE